MNLRKLTSSLGAILTVVISILLYTSCSDTETTDSTSFTIYYTGMTDIGPSMVGTISKPTYKGPTPSDFAITNITFNGEPYSGNSFDINSETGEVSILNTQDAATGIYKISISCQASGETYRFEDIVTVKLLAAAPSGVVATPELLKADYGDVIDVNSLTNMPTAIITTNGEHISITSYKIGTIELVTDDSTPDSPVYAPLEDKYKSCFSISSEGKFAIVQEEESQILEPATYSISLILGTKIQETILERAIKVQITSKPLSLTYANNNGKIEEKTTAEPTTFNSVIPVFKGSTEDLKFSISSITPQTDKIKINEKNGLIYVEDNHGFKKGEIYKISVCARNAYNTAEEVGTIFSDIFILETVSFIQPINKFSYHADGGNIQKVELSRFIIQPEIEGDEVKFSSPNYPDALKNNGITFNPNDGTITAIKGNKSAKGTYNFTIVATNPKGSKTAEVKLNIIDNPNKFTYIHFGNNLGANEASLEGNEYQNQFRFYTFLNIEVSPETDYKGDSPLKWSAETIRHLEPQDGYPNKDGKIKFKDWRKSPYLKNSDCGIMLVTATAGDDPDTQVSVTVPIFFHMQQKPNYLFEYTPFAVRINPKTGGSSVTPKISTQGVEATPDQRSKLILDYRREFNYYNWGGKRSDGTLHESGRPDQGNPFMQSLWDKCGAVYGAKYPLSYYGSDNKTPKQDWAKTLGYIDNGNDDSKKYAVNIIANQWYDKGWANGFFVGTMTYTLTGNPSDVNNTTVKPITATEVVPCVIWLDENL